MNISLINAIELIAAFQAFSFAIYLLVSQRTKSSSNRFIAVFLILLGVNLLQDFINYFIEPISANLSSFFSLTLFLLPASLYLYSKSVLNSEFELSKKSFWHILPFFLTNAIVFPFVYLENLQENPVESPILEPITIGFYFLFYFLLFGYQYASFKLLKKNKKLYFENFSNNDLQRYKYLNQLNIIFTLLYCVSALKNFLMFNIDGPFLEVIILLLKLALLFVFCWIGYNGINKPYVFTLPMKNLKPVIDLLKEIKPDKLNLAPKNEVPENKLENEKMLNKARQIMESEEPYLDASLSIHDLAEKVQMPTKELSVLINHHLNQHFFDFVNEYRIRKAMELLRNPDNKKKTILEVLYEVGFNSKSSFNTAFKKYTGITPTEYKKKAMLSVA